MENSIKIQCEDLEILLQNKNKDYGNSVQRSLNKYGDIAFMVRLEDKFNRLENLFRNGQRCVEDEGFLDTVRDIAGYCVLFLAIKDK